MYQPTFSTHVTTYRQIIIPIPNHGILRMTDCSHYLLLFGGTPAAPLRHPSRNPFGLLMLLVVVIPALALRPYLQPISSPTIRRVSSSPTMLPRREEQLHQVARQAILHRDFDEAIQCYTLAKSLPGFRSSRSYLLSALLHSRLGQLEEARQSFSEGVLMHRTDAKLIQAWGLFESKQGRLRRAMLLLRRAVALDESLDGVLRWRKFARASTHTSRASPASILMSATGKVTRQPLRPMQLVERPSVVYTVPLSRRGWRGRSDVGEDPGKWYDAEGERNGPPPNYWE